MKIAIIPARGGSKRIPGKNIRNFLGKPIIGYSIEGALQSGLFDRVIVTTDSEKVAETASSFGAEIPFIRSADLSDDYATMTDVMLDCVEKLLNDNYKFDMFCCLMPTAPFIFPELLVDANKLTLDPNNDAVISVSEYPFPIQRAFVRNERGFLTLREPEFEMRRSNDLEPAYHDAGQFYFLRLKPFLEQNRFFMSASKPFILPPHMVQDIDTEDDWIYAEQLYETLLKRGERC